MQDLNNKTVVTVGADDEQTISLNDLFRNIKARWSWYVVSLIAVIILATVYLLHATPMFTRTTDILLKDDNTQNFFSTEVSEMMGMNSTPASILNEMFVLSSPEVMEQVVNRLELNQVYKYPVALRKQELYHNSPIVVEWADSTLIDKSFSFVIDVTDDHKNVTLSKFKVSKDKFSGKASGAIGEPIETPIGVISVHATNFMENPPKGMDEAPTRIYFNYTPEKVCARDYCKKLKTEYNEDRGDVISMTISCETAKKATEVLEEIVKTYNDRWIAERSKTALATSTFIDDRLKAIEDELGDVETTISDFKSAHRMIDMDAMAQIYLSQSVENQRQLNALSQQIAIARFIKNELTGNDLSRLLPATAEIAGTDIQALVTAYNTSVNDRNTKLISMPEDSPLIIQKTETIKKQRDAILSSVETALEALNVQYNAITNFDNKTQSQIASAPGQAKYLMSEERKQKVKEALYVFLLQRREENELGQAFTSYNIRMVTEPYGLSTPTSPKKMMIYLIAVFIGLIIPTLMIYIREVTNTCVRSRKDIESLPLPFVGEIPQIDSHRSAFKRWADKLKLKGVRKSSDKSMVRPLMVHKGERSLTAESFRMVRANMDFMRSMQTIENTNDKGRVVMVVSLNAGSGKTFVSLNLAASYALKGSRVCLVDFDLRKGTVSLNAGNRAHGLTDYLIGRELDLTKLVVKDIDGISGFDILPEGMRPPNPTELLYSSRLIPLIEWLKSNYDYVFFDCPPVEIVADPLILAPFADMTIFVMRAGVFDRSDLPYLSNLYSSRRYNNLAVVLNGTDQVHGVYGQYGYGANYVKGSHYSF